MGLGLHVEGGIRQPNGPHIVIGKIIDGSDAARVGSYNGKFKLDCLKFGEDFDAQRNIIRVRIFHMYICLP